MLRFRIVILIWAFILTFLGIGAFTASWADTPYQLQSPNGAAVPLTTVNQKREANSLVLYTPTYGTKTRTNPYGVEVSATLVPGSKDQYQVQQTTDLHTCEAQQQLSQCGNMAIPQDGVVLSANGDKQDLLTQSFPVGSIFTLNQRLTYQSELSLNAIDPTAQTNPAGDGFPGFRGGNQLIVYDSHYGQPTTGTNEFGYEVTVKDNRVVAQEGSNSQIPTEEKAFILSGHGKAREWLLANAPIGSKIEIQDNMVTSTIDKNTYLYQIDTLVQKIEQLRNGLLPQKDAEKVDYLKEEALFQPDEVVAQKALALKQALTPLLWSSYPDVPGAATKAIWHRPSESTIGEIQQSLNLMQKAGFNTIYLETYIHGDPIFPSTTFDAYHIPERMAFELTNNNHKDLLKVWLSEAHKRHMKVHVWFQTFYAANRVFDKDMGNIIKTYPDWVNIQRSALGKDTIPPSTLEPGAYFLDPANPKVQSFLLSLIDEIITRYPIDGFQLDYIRYPASFPPDRYSYIATTWGYTPVAREAFKTQYGLDPADITPTDNPQLWEDWNAYKVSQVDSFVQKVHDLVKAKRPDLPLSADVFPDPKSSLIRKEQNWVAWAQNGWVDFLVPMTLTSSLESIVKDTREMKDKIHVPVITGIFGPFNGDSPSHVVDEVWSAFTSGANGVAVFDTSHLTQEMAQALRMGLFKASQKH